MGDDHAGGRTGLGLPPNPTFSEAFERTGRLINVTCTPFKTTVKGSPPLILNHLTAPNVTLASAVCASSCVPMLIEPVALLEKVRGVSLLAGCLGRGRIVAQLSQKLIGLTFDEPLSRHFAQRN